MRDAIDLLEKNLAHEAAGRTAVSPKFTTEFHGGAMRVLFAADNEAGYCAMKAYHSIKGVGTRYVVLLYRLQDGELLALLDGRLITDLRTGAASGVAAARNQPVVATASTRTTELVFKGDLKDCRLLSAVGNRTARLSDRRAPGRCHRRWPHLQWRVGT